MRLDILAIRDIVHGLPPLALLTLGNLGHGLVVLRAFGAIGRVPAPCG